MIGLNGGFNINSYVEINVINETRKTLIKQGAHPVWDQTFEFQINTQDVEVLY